jgi:ferritin-like protein
MADSSATLHESAEKLGPEVINQHRAIVSLMEELEAIDWYDQRVKATDDPTLAAVLAHNRDEEKEHAVMTLEWLRRHDPVLDRHLRTYLFTEEPITEIEVEAEAEMGGMGTGVSVGVGAGAGGPSGDGSLGLGNLGRSA